jgi:flagellum-specific peptidoglycan hydrolase FlgJ
LTHPIPADVIAAAQAADRKWGVPAAVTLAQWALESGWGAHMPPGSNNPFGIKALPRGASVLVPTREHLNGAWTTVNAYFRKFDTIADAFDAHGKLLHDGGAYAAARACGRDDDRFGNALTGHYATDPNYGSLLRSIMHGGNFSQYDVTHA